jgi:hypothetical protein
MYLVEGLLQQGGGGDNFAVGWQLPDGTMERPIPGNRLIPLYNPLTLNDEVQVKIISPVEGATVSSKDSFDIVVEVPNGIEEVSSVKFFSSPIKMIGVDKTPESNIFTLRTKLPAAKYKLTAKGMFRHILSIPSDPVNITTSPNVSADDILADDGFEVYPNPLADGSLTVKVPEGTQYLSVIDMTGKTIFEKKVAQNTYQISHSLFSSSGVYIVKILTAKNTFSKKIAVKM